MTKAALLACTALAAVSCIGDTGNYDYVDKDEIMPVKISGLEDELNFTIFETETLNPVVEGMDDPKNYQFTWYMMESGKSVKSADTLAVTKDLNWTVDCVSGYYDLVFEVKDLRTKLFANKVMRMVVASSYSVGWFVVKDRDGKTDLDMIYPDGTTGTDLLARGGNQLDGTARGITYSYSHSHEFVQPDGTVKVEGVKAYTVYSDKDLKVFHGDNLSLLKNYEDFFYAAPEVRNPQKLIGVSQGYLLINDGKMHALYDASANVGKMGPPKDGPDNYNMHPSQMEISNYIGFDMTSRTFVGARPYEPDLYIRDNPTSDSPVQVSPQKMDYDLIAMTQKGYSTTGYAIMKSRTAEDEYALFGLSSTGTSNFPFTSYETLPQGLMLPHADAWAAHQNASCIYFGKGNRLWAHTVADVPEREKVIVEYPAGENVAFIRHAYQNNTMYKYSMLAVLTNDGTNWKLYIYQFDGDTPALQSDPEVYTGPGNARYAMYRYS